MPPCSCRRRRPTSNAPLMNESSPGSWFLSARLSAPVLCCCEAYQMARRPLGANAVGKRRGCRHRPQVSPGITSGAGVLSLQKVRPRRKPMQVSEILKVKGNALFTIAPEGKLAEAVSIMAQHNMGSLVVIDKGRMAGMLTFKEILLAVDKGRGALGDAKVGDVLEPDPVSAIAARTSRSESQIRRSSRI